MQPSITVLLLTIMLFVGCASAPPQPMERPVAAERSTYLHGGQVLAVEQSRERSADRLIATTVTVTLKTLAPDSVHKRVVTLALALDGYVLESGDRSTTIRVPSDSLETALERIESMAEVVSRAMAGQDVTDEYVDLETRLKNAERTRDRYLALLDQAETIQEMLTLERELERINGIIEGLKGRIQQLSNRITYASITVKTSEGVKPGPVAWLFGQMYKGVKWLFVRN